MAERQIGEELAKLPSAQGRRSDLVGSTDKVDEAATLDELGFRGSPGRERAAEYKQLAAAPAEVVETAVSAATAEGCPVTKADLRRVS